MRLELPENERRALMRISDQVARAEDALIVARYNLLDAISRLIEIGYSQSAIARALGITRATLNQKLRMAGLLAGRGGARQARKSKASNGGKQGKHTPSHGNRDRSTPRPADLTEMGSGISPGTQDPARHRGPRTPGAGPTTRP